MSSDLKQSYNCQNDDEIKPNPDYIPPASMPAGGLLGWVCPKCGAALSPFVNYCVKCSNNWEITYGTGAFTSSKYNGGNSNE